jgi:hypothetical protein
VRLQPIILSDACVPLRHWFDRVFHCASAHVLSSCMRRHHAAEPCGHAKHPNCCCCRMAGTVVVNSHFTAGVFASTFTQLAAKGVVPQVLYPAVPLPAEEELQEASSSWQEELPSELAAFVSEGPTFLSINRCSSCHLVRALNRHALVVCALLFCGQRCCSLW